MARHRSHGQTSAVTKTLTSDVLVVGGGLVGAALAFGMAGAGATVRILDGGDGDIRAAHANFGLIWVQSKGLDMPAYARWTRQSADLWGAFAAELGDLTGVSLHHRQRGGLSYCLGEKELDDKRAEIARLHNQRTPWSPEVTVLDRTELAGLLPGVTLGPAVRGASFCPQDGECNPLALLRSLHHALAAQGVTLHRNARALSVTAMAGRFRVITEQGGFETPRLVLAAGLGSKPLAESLGIAAPIRPQRGQILVTERLPEFLRFAGDTLRQTADGTLMVGATHEDTGLDVSTTSVASAELARHAVSVFPDLARVNLVRTWAGLRVLTPDGNPLYAESEDHPGAVMVTCHSGVTLAAAHARLLAPAILAGPLGPEFAPFSAARFG
jgi:glycine/D-amino acid oxidase-like deaminating enzyme